MSWSSVEMRVIQWAEARKIIPGTDPGDQLIQAMKHLDKLCDAEAKKQHDDIQDALGDALVALVNYCALHDVDMTQCLKQAYKRLPRNNDVEHEHCLKVERSAQQLVDVKDDA